MYLRQGQINKLDKIKNAIARVVLGTADPHTIVSLMFEAEGIHEASRAAGLLKG